MGQKRRKKEIVEEYNSGECSFRELEGRYGISSSTIHRWVKERRAGVEEVEREKLVETRWRIAEKSGVVAEIERLRRELAEERLRNDLLNTMIDIAEEQMGVDIRKKRGAKRR